MDPASPTAELERLGGRGLAACAAAASLAGIVYVNALHNPFVYDDERTILDNASIWNLRDLRSIVLHEVTRPLVNLSYAIDRVIWGAAPFGFHVTSVLMHVLNVTLLFRLVWHLASDRSSGSESGSRSAERPLVAAFAAAALFAVHPVMTEAVGYISGRAEVLCATFFLSALLCARRWMKGDGTAWWLATFGLWIAALLTKEIAVMLPAVVLCYDRCLLGGSPADRRRRLLRLHLPLFAATLAAGAVRLAVFVGMEHPGDVSVRWLSVFDELDVIRRYVVLILAPGGQTIFHEVVPLHSLFDRRTLIGVGAVGSIAAVAWWVRRVEAGASLGLFWFLSLLVPSSVLVILDQGDGMAEHRVYLASCGLFLAGALAIARAWSALDRARLPVRILARTALAITLLSLSGRTILRNAIWASPVRLWREAADRAPGQWLPHAVLGEALDGAGLHEDAVVAYKAALRLRPQEEAGYMKLSMCLAELGRVDEAKATLETLRVRSPQSTTVSTGLGAVAMISGNPDRARRHFLETIERDPRDVTARQWLAVLAEDVEANPAEALRWCEAIQQLAPGRLTTDRCIQRNRSRLAATDGPAR
jgi:Flp pilus assembly protein TadD